MKENPVRSGDLYPEVLHQEDLPIFQLREEGLVRKGGGIPGEISNGK